MQRTPDGGPDTTDPASVYHRVGTESDVPAVLALIDDAVRWLAEQGRTGQWGTEPQSTNPRRIAMVTGWARESGLVLACVPGDGERVVGALAVGVARSYVPPVNEPELYVNLLVTDRGWAGRGIGGALLDEARRIAVDRRATLLRVDCYAGGDRALVRYYERAGFTAAEPFTIDQPGGPWPGQILSQRIR
ncbi:MULTISPECIES: GNAT family N-acetyltransferase [unclassified Solwaraspora]|uniref:GNAT family N-acetyltransferase n=1 Tax=unclassified Solwaraspora TaxID=2627926 RepID=UPI00259BCD05|nr:GNAT family N-acetyltransferase [Solwaraspora sp. WMMA2056]WJK40096.1 GNAT family N-acetyltransferase [Solwaraspora sp. WMMA2056]